MDEEDTFDHELVGLLLRLRKAAENPVDALAQAVAAVTMVEVDGILQSFRTWKDDPTWAEYQKAVRDPRGYLHAVTTLTMATALREHHSGTRLLASGGANAFSTPDLLMVVGDQYNLAVEVKTSLSLTGRSEAMTRSEAVDFIARKVAEATDGFRAQLAQGRPSVLVIGGSKMDPGTFQALGDAAMQVMREGRERSDLLAIVISHTRYFIPDPPPKGWQVALAHETRIRTNPLYKGDLELVGEWAGNWQLTQASALARITCNMNAPAGPQAIE